MANNGSTIWGKIDLDIKNFASKLAHAGSMMGRFAASTATQVSGAQSNFSKYSKEITKATEEIHKHRVGLKDVTRIVAGIVISQTFYGITRSIREANNALWEFNEALDYASVTYGAMFGGTQIATDFLKVLKEHAEETVFSFEDLTDMSKKLIAYGIPKESLMYITEGLTNLGAMSGDAAALDRIALALGQIYTKGKLSAEEMRQLANAYVPIYDIVKSQFGLTGDQMKSVGDLNLPAADVINAVVDYANKTFGNVGDAAMLTLTGLKQKIADSLKNFGVDMVAPISAAYKSFLAYVSSGLDSLRATFESGGAGALFERLVPNENTRQAIRQFIANVKNSFMSLVSVLKVVGQVVGNMGYVFISAFNVIAPVVNSALNAISYFLSATLQTSQGAATLRTALMLAAGAFAILRVQALYATIVTAFTKVINGLSKALVTLAGIIARHPIFMLFALLGVGLGAVAMSSEKANTSLSKLFDGLGGKTSSNSVLQTVEKDVNEAVDATEQFNEKLKQGKDAADALTDSIRGTGKEAKKTGDLLSFDEVFKLNEQNNNGTSSSGTLGAIDDLIEGIGGIGGDLADALEIPDFSDYIKNFTEGLFGGLADKIPESIRKAGIGALIGSLLGGILGGIIGGPAGVKIGMGLGAIAGGIVSWLVEKLDLSFSNTAIGGGLGIAQVIAKAFGGAISDLPSLLTATSVSGFFKNFADLFKGAGLKSVLKGGLIGMAIGFVVDAIAAAFFKWLAEALELEGNAVGNAKIGMTIGSILGSIIGTAIGGPAGTIIGSAIGTFAGGLVGLFYEEIKEAFESEASKIADAIGLSPSAAENAWYGFLNGLTNGLIQALASGNPLDILFLPLKRAIQQGIIGMLWEDGWEGLSKWWTDTKDGFKDWAEKTYKALSTWWTDTKSGLTTWWTDTKKGLSTWWTDTVDTFSDWSTINGNTLGDWITDTKTKLFSWVSTTFEKFSSWYKDTKDGFEEWRKDTGLKLSTWRTTSSDTLFWWAKEASTYISNWCTKAYNNISSWVTDTLSKVSTWSTDARTSIATWAAETLSKILLWKTETVLKFNKWKEDTITAVTTFKTDAITVIQGFKKASAEAFTQWCAETLSKLAIWFTDLVLKIKGWWEKCWVVKTWNTGWSSVSSWFSSLMSSISGWFTDRKTSISTWWKNLWNHKGNKWTTGWDSIKTWFSDLLTYIGDWFTDIKRSIKNWWDGLWDLDSPSLSGPSVTSTSNGIKIGHATGGIFNREHIARFAEGNKAEAVIPLENYSAMRPFVDAISDGILSGLAPVLAVNGSSSSNQLQPLYVGTLIADDRGLEQLYKRFEVYEAKENARKGY